MATDPVSLGTFARQWAVEGSRVSWLLGAGASAAAGVPTAGHIVADLLARLYADAHDLVRDELDTSDPAVWVAVTHYYDGANGMPPAGDPSDYSTAFELALPDDGPRRQYLRALLAGHTPSFGQRVLGAFLTQGLTDLVFTTNFDELIELAGDDARAAAPPTGRPRLGVAALGDPDRAAVALSDNDFPLLIKLHGDFRERELRNLDQELQDQDATLRRALVDASRRFGLAVAGYSGRDRSVMYALRDAVSQPEAFPAGLWWLTRSPTEVGPDVTGLLEYARERGVTTHLVEVDTFDETLAALARQASLQPVLRAYLETHRARPRVIDAALPALDAGELPVLRMNALPIRDAPRQALTAPLPDAATAESIRNALKEARFRGEVVPAGQNVLAFGSATHLQRALSLPHVPTPAPFDCLSVDATTQHRALALYALGRALARTLPVRMSSRDGIVRLIVRAPNPQRTDRAEQADARATLSDAYQAALSGTAPTSLGLGPDGQRRAWAEAVRLSLEWRLGTMWLLFVPYTWVSAPVKPIDTSAGRGDPASAWRKELWVNRRNEKWAAILAAWAAVLAPMEPTTVNAVADTDATGGTFLISKTTAYSRVAR